MRATKHHFKTRRRGSSWQVDFGMVNGKRVQKSCKTKTDAEEWAKVKSDELTKSGHAAFALSDRHRSDALEAYRKLADAFELTVADLPLGEATLQNAVDFYIERAMPEGGVVTFAQLADDYIASKLQNNRRPATINDVRSRMTRVATALGQEPVHLITTLQLEDWLNSHKYSGVTRKNYRTHLVMLFNYAIHRQFRKDNPAISLGVPSVDEKLPEILSVAECKALMAATAQHEPKMVPYFAIALFAGLRPTEAIGLDWRNVDLDARQIKVIPETAKKRRLRFVEISDNLAKWLRPHQQAAGQIYFLRKHFERARKKAKVTWAHDVLRHSYASYHLAMHENQDKTSLQLGHRNTDILFNHYRNLVTRKEATAFWSIHEMQQAQRPGSAPAL